MPLFKSKPKLSIEECCKQFYAAIIAGTVWSTFLDTSFKDFVELDQSLASIDRTLFRNEMTALYLELFAFAWSQRFKKDQYAVQQSIFTRSYLEENESLEIWDIMAEYNKVISDSVITYANGAKYSGRIGNANIVALNIFRAGLVKEWGKHIMGTQSTEEQKNNNYLCAGRVINRVGADIKRADRIVVKLLAAMLAERLGCDVNLKFEAFSEFAGTILGIYNGAEVYLKSVDLQG